MKQALEGFYKDLQAIWDTEFPKTCAACQRTYDSMENFFAQTAPLPANSGLMGYDDGEKEQQVGLFRNCVCGSTLMVFCRDRRDLSGKGETRRHLIGEMITKLTRAGLSSTEARSRLLEALTSGDPAQLETLWQDAENS